VRALLGRRRVVQLRAPEVRLGRRRVSWFQVWGVVGVATSLLVALVGAHLRGLSAGPVLVLAVVAVVAFLILAVSTALVVGEGRLTWFHHQLTVLAACAVALHVLGRPELAYLDVVGTALLTFSAVGRLGCLAVGCCHGRPARSGVVYGPAHVAVGFPSAYAGVTLFPVALWEACASGLLSGVAVWILATPAPPGIALTLSLVGYAAARFVLEHLRGDPRPQAGGLSEAQWTATVVATATLLLNVGGAVFVPDSLAAVAAVVLGAAVLQLARGLTSARPAAAGEGRS
jgi:hypothetical protein